MFLGYLFRACKRFCRSDAHVHTYSNMHNWVWVAPLQTQSTPVSSPRLFQGWRPAGMVGVANRAEAEGAAAQGLVCLRGAATSTAGCYLKKLVPRPLPHLDTLLPSRPGPSLYTPTPLSLCSYSQTARSTFSNHLLHLCDVHWEGMMVCWSVCVHV